MMRTTTKKIALYGILIALAFILSYLESLLPNPFYSIAPGIKLGLSNLVIILVLVRLGMIPAFFVSLVRILLTAFTFGNLSMAIYSLAGALLSILSMALLQKLKRFGTLGISVVGGLTHNLGQILIAMAILGSNLIFYLPYLFLGGLLSGFLVGLLATLINRRLPHRL